MKSYDQKTNPDFLETSIFKTMTKFILDFKKFNNISDTQKSKLEKLAIDFENNAYVESNYLKYLKALQYISTKYGRKKIVETRDEIDSLVVKFDENILFMIMYCDPECNLYTSYLKCDKNLSSLEKESLCRQQNGFFSKYLLIAEKFYYHKYINKLITEVNNDLSDYLVDYKNELNSFDTITDKRYEEIQELASLWRDSIENSAYFQTALYNIIHQSNLLNLNSLEEKIAFFISAVDSELIILKTYEKECKMNIIEEKIEKKFGIFIKELIEYEKLYEKRFCTNKISNKWTKKKVLI